MVRPREGRHSSTGKLVRYLADPQKDGATRMAMSADVFRDDHFQIGWAKIKEQEASR
jgi:hypothetical protein